MHAPYRIHAHNLKTVDSVNIFRDTVDVSCWAMVDLGR